MDPTTLWTMAKPILAGQLRHVLGGLAFTLAAHGALQASQENQFIEIGMGLASYLAIAGWSWWKNQGQGQVSALLQKLTSTDTVKNAVIAAKVLPVAAAVDTPTKAVTVQSVVGKAAAMLMIGVIVAGTLFAPAAQAAGRKAIASPIINAFNALSALVEKDGAGAVTLSTQIPELRDYVGQACFTQIALIGQVVKAHKLPLTLQVATDFEAARLVGMALNRICANPNCGQVWTDVQNVVTAINPGVIPVSLPSICAKIPVMGTVAISQVPATPAPAASGGVIAPAAAPAAKPAPAPDFK